MNDQPRDPPSFAALAELEKAADDNGYRLEDGLAAGWLVRRSTTARGRILLATCGDAGPWLLGLDHTGVWQELSDGLPVWNGPSPHGASGVVRLANLAHLHRACARVYRLSRALPDAPLDRFSTRVEDMPRSTEAERLVVQRVGQEVFREALLDYWDGRCPLTGITDGALLRASHIVPWASCETDAARLDVHNGLLLSAHWDAAFDAGLVSFADDGAALVAPALTAAARGVLAIERAPALPRLTDRHRANLASHRTMYGFASAASHRRDVP